MSNNESYAWGGNNYGQLGYPSYNANFVQVSNIDDVIESAGGYQHSLVLKEDGTVWAWGRNNYGQLGDGTNTDSNEPVQVKNLTNIIDIAAGDYHSLAIKSDGTAWAWGYNSNGQLGDGTNTNSNQPVQVSNITGLSSVIGMSGGDSHSLAIKSDGTAWAWGGNWFGQLGDGTTTARNQPVQVSTITGLTNVTAISVGGYHNLAIKSDGTAWAWGNNWYGQLGDGTTTARNQPVQVSTITGLTSIIDISGGGSHSLAVKSDGTVWAWGSNWAGQLGDGTNTNSYQPVQVSSLTNVQSVAGGEYHSLAIKSDGTTWAWGSNDYGQLGDGTITNSNEPVQISSLTNVHSVAAGGYHSLTVKNNGTMWVWGNNYYGQLGLEFFGGFSSNPVLVNSINNIQVIAAGNGFNLALKSDGKVRAWGNNWYGQLGDGTTGGTTDTPVLVVNLTNVIAVATGIYHSLALKNDGTV